MTDAASTPTTVTIDELVVADAPEAWSAAGFTVDPDGSCRVGSVRLRFAGTGATRGIVGWSLRDVPSGLADVDGIATRRSEQPVAAAAAHPNGVLSIDHVVLASPDLARTTDVLSELGLEPRRTRDGELGGVPVRQVFYRLGGEILEVVGSPDAAAEGPSSVWGVTFVIDDLDAAAARYGDDLSRIRPAVQPGRRIATLRHRPLGLSVRTALISP